MATYNKRKHTEQFSAALQIARCYGRYVSLTKENFMVKFTKTLFFISLLLASNFVLALPTFYSNLKVKQIETWPNASNPQYGYTVILTSSMPNTGCPNSDRFSVEAGDFQEESLSVLLAAMMANKEIRVRVARCTDRPIVDRVGILNN